MPPNSSSSSLKLTASLFQAIAKSPAKSVPKGFADRPIPGIHTVDAVVRVRATLRQAEDHSSIVNESIPWETLALLCIDRLAPQVRSAVLAEIARIQNLPEDSDDGALATIGELKRSTVRIWDTLGLRATKTVKGALTVSGATVDVISIEADDFEALPLETLQEPGSKKPGSRAKGR